MTTKTTKPVVRESSAIDAHRNIIVILGPGELIGFRLKGTRKVYTTTVSSCYLKAVKAEIFAQRMAKAAARKGRR